MVKIKSERLQAKSLIYMAVGFLLFAVLAPIGLGEIYNATTTGWEAAVITIFQVLAPILYIIGSALYFIDF